MPTTISNADAVPHFTVKDVRDYFAGEGIDVVGKSISMGTDAIGMVSTMTVDVILTAPQIAAFELEFFPKNLTPLTTKGDVLTHDGTNEVRLPVGLDGQVLQALASAPEGLAFVNGGFEKIADETLGVAGNSMDVNFPTREFLFIILLLEADTTTNLNAEFNFNGDFGPSYAFRRNENFGTITSNTNQDRVQLDANTVDKTVSSTIMVFNKVGDTTQFIQRSVGVDGVTAGTLPQTQNSDGIWYANDLVFQINVRTTIGAFSTNSRVVVFGSNP